MSCSQIHQKYKFMEGSLASRRRKLKSQVPDIKSSLAMITKLREKKEAEETMETQFLLSEQVYARAKVFSVLSDDRNLSNHNDLYLY